MNLLQQIKENKFKVSQLEKVSINILGIEEETDKAIKLLAFNRNGEAKSVWIPKSVILDGGEKDIVFVKGWFAAKEMFGFVKKENWIN